MEWSECVCFKFYEVGINLPRIDYVKYIITPSNNMFISAFAHMPVRKIGLSVSMMIMLFLLFKVKWYEVETKY